jgi:hypothetical protein
MKKKLVSVLLSAAMAATLLAGCGNSDSTDTEASSEPATEATSEAETEADTSAAEPEAEETGSVEAEELPEAVYYYSFDAADDSDSIHAVKQDTLQETSAEKLTLTDGEKTYISGVKGDALYVNGNTGYKLTDVNGVGDTYTVSFWVYSTRYADYMPAIQFGPDVYGDNTGCANWVNITTTTFSDDAVSAFPTIWSRNETDDTWPFIVEAAGNNRLKEWTNITLVVDGTRTSTDGTMLVADLYINGELLVRTDADGNVAETLVSKGCMDASDYFDFLVGVNYWDSVFKGAFDELYIFDQALTAGQALTLYQMGDPTVEFEEPDRVVEVTATEDALYTLGTTDLTAAFWSDWTPTTEIKDGETKEITLKNYSDGANSWDNFVIGFVNEASDGSSNPNEADGYQEYAITRADLFSWGGEGFDESTSEYTYSWGNWDTWRTSVMVDTDVSMSITRSGSDLTINYDFVDYNGTDNTATAVLHTTLTADDPCYFFFTNEASYVEIYSIKDAISITPDESAIATIGNTDYTNAWWTEWTDAVELADGATKTVVLNNYSDGVNNYDNYVVGFENEATVAGTDPNTNVDTHIEYAMVRADAYGWDDAEFTYETNWGDDWATWLESMKSAQVTLVISRNGNVITVDATAVCSNGNTYTNLTTVSSNVLTAADPLYFFITGEECYIEILSIE